MHTLSSLISRVALIPFVSGSTPEDHLQPSARATADSQLQRAMKNSQHGCWNPRCSGKDSQNHTTGGTPADGPSG